MGCAVSSSDDRSSNTNVFDVANIDDGGQERSAGKIRVSATELILFYPNREEIRWPIRSLRRYGYNDQLFSFESGRRCQTGQGIYAFRCADAHLLFQQLQESISRAGEERTTAAETGQMDQNSVPALQGTGPGDQFADYINCPHFSAARRRTYVNQNITDQPRTNLSRPFLAQNICCRIRSDTAGLGLGPGLDPGLDLVSGPSSRGSVLYAELDLPVACETVELDDYDEEADVFNSPEVNGCESFRSSAYVNVPVPVSGPTRADASGVPTGNGSANSNHVTVSKTGAVTNLLTYAQLDLDTPTCASRPVSQSCSSEGVSPGWLKSSCPSARGKSEAESYAAIDFQRTSALSRKASEIEDEGLRKTRHNSNIEMLSRN